MKKETRELFIKALLKEGFEPNVPAAQIKEEMDDLVLSVLYAGDEDNLESSIEEFKMGLDSDDSSTIQRERNRSNIITETFIIKEGIMEEHNKKIEEHYKVIDRCLDEQKKMMDKNEKKVADSLETKDFVVDREFDKYIKQERKEL